MYLWFRVRLCSPFFQSFYSLGKLPIFKPLLRSFIWKPQKPLGTFPLFQEKLDWGLMFQTQYLAISALFLAVCKISVRLPALSLSLSHVSTYVKWEWQLYLRGMSQSFTYKQIGILGWSCSTNKKFSDWWASLGRSWKQKQNHIVEGLDLFFFSHKSQLLCMLSVCVILLYFITRISFQI